MTSIGRIHAIFYNNPDTYPPIINSSRVLADSGFQVDLNCRRGTEQWNVFYPDRVQIDRIGAGELGSWREYVAFVVRSVQGAHDPPSVFIGHDMHGLLPAWLLARRFRRPLVYYCHDFSDRSLPLGWGGRLVRGFEQRFARTADLVIVPDANRGRVIKRTLRLKDEPLVVANAPLARPAVSRGALAAALTSRGISLSRVVFRPGRIGFGHGIEVTVRSMPAWADPTWGFVVMGSGDPNYLQHLVNLALELGVEDRFVVLPPVGYDSIHEFTTGADLGHALYEPIHINHVHCATASNKIMEYMAAGLPLLVSDTPDLRDLLHRHGSGATADESSPESVAQAVNQLLGDTQRLRVMGHAAASAFENEFCFPRQFGPAVDAIRAMSQNS